MFRRLRRSFRRWGFPVIGWLSAGMYLLIAGGLPLPLSSSIKKDISTPFPCMNSPCGCQNAEQCWSSCCCHSPAERLAWARQHGITSPKTLIVVVDADSSTTRRATCCADAGPKTCCSAKARSCCSSNTGTCHSSSAVESEKLTVSGTVIGIYALACHGFGTDWLTSLIAVPPNIVGCDYLPLPVGSVSTPPLHFSSAVFPPPVPPPRNAAA